MYFEYFGLSENPFTIAPNPKYLFMSTRHQEALAHLLYGVKEGGGFVQLTGEVGTGKTTLTRALLEQLPDNVDVALILNPKLTAQEFVAAICDELHVSYETGHDSVKVLVDALNDFLLTSHANGRRVVLIVDEAQNFQPDVLEQIRLLTNLETTQQKLLQIILVGQPELRDLLARRELRQLAQRITARYHLVPMSYEEMQGYIKHRLKVAGCNAPLFNSSALKQLWRHTGGVPRLVNILADRSLMGAYSAEVQKITTTIVNQAQKELHAVDSHATQTRPVLRYALVGVLIMLCGGYVGYELSTAQKTQQQPLVVTKEPVIIEQQEKIVSEIPSNDVVQTVSQEEEANEVVQEGHVSDVLTRSEFSELLFTSTNNADLNVAFVNLFSLWGGEYLELRGVTGCEKALTIRKRCFWGDSGLQELLKLNYPALVWLSNPDKPKVKHYFVIRGFEGENVSIQLGDLATSISFSELNKIWPRKYLILWQPPSVDFDIVRPGNQGNIVLWLRQNISQVLGIEIAATQPDVYDAELVTYVKQFQRQQGLDADGLVGELTVLYLSAVSRGKNFPRLTTVIH